MCKIIVLVIQTLHCQRQYCWRRRLWAVLWKVQFNISSPPPLMWHRGSFLLFFSFFFYFHCLMLSQLPGLKVQNINNKKIKCFHAAHLPNHGSVWTGQRPPRPQLCSHIGFSWLQFCKINLPKVDLGPLLVSLLHFISHLGLVAWTWKQQGPHIMQRIANAWW